MIRFIINHFFFVCLLLVAGIVYFLTMTTPGLQIDIALITSFLPGKLQIESMEGQLFSRFSCKHIFYQNESQTVSIHSLAISWNPAGLLLHKLILNSIDIDHANVVINKISAPSSTSHHTHLASYLKDITFKQATFNNVIVTIADNQIYLNGDLHKEWNLQWKASIPQLAKLIPNTKGSVITSGTISGAFLTPTINGILQASQLAYANQTIDQMKLQALVVIQPDANSTLSAVANGIKINSHNLKKLDFTLTGNIKRTKKSISAILTALIDHRYPLTATITLPQFAGFTHLDQPVNGQITSSIHQLDFLTSYITQIKEPKGNVRSTLLIKGTLAKPEWALNLIILNGQVKIPLLGITPQQINLQGSTNFTKQFSFAGRMNSGKGNAQLQGFIDFSQPNYPVSLQIKGSLLQAIHLPEYNVVISPNLALHYVKQNLQLQGDIVIPSAHITPQNVSSTVTLPSSVVFVGSKQPTPLPFTTSLQLHVHLGDNIYLAYHDLQANLGGNLQLNQQPGTLINAVGELFTKNGTYTAYGQTLLIRTGRLIYTGGSLMNPGLTISAIKELKTVNTGGNVSSFSGQTSLQPIYTGTQSVVVGVEVAGTLQNPTFNLFSTPSMPQGDILSYLVFGFPQSQASGNQYGAILSALSSLNPTMPSAGGLTKDIEKKFGLTELSVQSVQTFNPNATSNANSVVSTTSFVIGKKLSNDLSIHYSVGLFYPVSILNLRYQLSKNWAIQSETSTLDNGADVLYSIERD